MIETEMENMKNIMSENKKEVEKTEIEKIVEKSDVSTESK